MFNESLQNIKTRLLRYTLARNMADMLSKTPAHATHWYVLLLVGLLITVGNVGAAWLVFHNMQNGTASVFEQQVTATTIQRDELQSVLDVYQARALELENVRATPPRIIDPGR